MSRASRGGGVDFVVTDVVEVAAVEAVLSEAIDDFALRVVVWDVAGNGVSEVNYERTRRTGADAAGRGRPAIVDVAEMGGDRLWRRRRAGKELRVRRKEARTKHQVAVMR